MHKACCELNHGLDMPIWGVTLIHRHFDLEDGEILLTDLKRTDDGTLSLQTTTIKASTLSTDDVECIYPFIIAQNASGDSSVHQWIRLEIDSVEIKTQIQNYQERLLQVVNVHERVGSKHQYGLLLNYPMLLDMHAHDGKLLNELTNMLERTQEIKPETVSSEGKIIDTQFFPPCSPCKKVPCRGCCNTSGKCDRALCESSYHHSSPHD
jgi:hypothetical protein